METLTDKNITAIIDKSLKTAMSYEDYRTLMDRLAENNGTTGPEQTESLINYTMLNQRRYKRWEKTLKISEEQLEQIRSIDTPQEWIVLTESWCGDAAHLMPVMKKIADENEHISIKVVLRDDNLELMDEYLTNGSRSIPKLISRNKENKDILFTYGPRPSTATKMVEDFKTMHGHLTAEFKEDLQRWYNKDKGRTAFKDLLDR